MSNFDYLLEHAEKHVWCTPEQDFQVIFSPAKISPRNGARNKLEILWVDVPLPTKTDWYHVYQIGEISPEQLGLSPVYNQWVSLQLHCNSQWVMLDLYVKSGLQLPRFEAYILRTRDGNVILAVKEQPTIADLGVNDIYLRFYSNAFFSRLAGNPDNDGLEVQGTRIATSDQQFAFQKKFRDSKLRKGHTYAFVNGYRVQALNPTTVKVGDIVEFVWDSSIKQVVELPVVDLPNFLSTFDSKEKYLLHYPGGIGQTIEYRDDIDLFLIQRTNENIFKGVYYHKNVEDAVRMVTHRDYSIPVQYVRGYANEIPGWGDPSKLTVQIHIRESGYYRPLVNEAHRIKELYKLPEADLVKALVGIDATVSVWQAAELETSKYPAIMRAKQGTITREMVQDAYGYNAISKLLADTPTLIPAGSTFVDLAYGLQNNSTIYEYNAAGTLLNWHVHTGGRYYAIRDTNCRMIEGIVGKGGNLLTTDYAKANTTLNREVNYRFYKRPLNSGVPYGEWQDVTGTADYTVSDGVAHWNIDQTKWYTAVKNDANFMAYDLNLDYRDGILRFTVNVDEIRSDGNIYPDKAEIPFAKLDLWLNGKALIKGLDYFVAWPEHCLINKEYLVPGLAQRISIRGYGFCKPDMTTEDAEEFGFVDHGLLSKNKRFDICDDKVMRYVVDGAVYDRSILHFSETDTGVRVNGFRNGAPYQISDIIVPMQGLTDKSTYDMRQESQVIDKEISDYLTLKMPEVPELNPNPIPRLYAVFSPFASKVMWDLKQGLIRTDDIQGQYSDMLVREMLVDHEWLLAYEPTYKSLDLDYVSIHPHNLYTEVTLDVYQYRFLLRAIRLYLNDKVDITKFVRIEMGFEHETPDHPHPHRILP